MDRRFFKNWIYGGLCLWAVLQPLSIAGANLAIAVIAAGVLAQACIEHSWPLRHGALEKPLWIYVLAGVLVSALGAGFGKSLGQIGKDSQMLADFYIFSAAFAAADGASILAFWAAGFSIAAILGLGQFALWRWDRPAAGAFNRLIAPSHFWSALYVSLRAHGTIHPVTFGEIMAMAVLGALALRISRRRAGQRAGALSAGFLLLALAALALSGTRGAWLGFFAGAAAIFLLEPRFAAPETVAAAAAIAAVVFLSPRFSHAEGSLNVKGPSFADHLSLWKTAWHMFLDHPLFGVGLSHFSTLFPKYHSVPFEGEIHFGNAHNLYLHQMAERGLAGLAALLLLLGTMARRAWLLRRKSFYGLWFLIWIIAFLFLNLTESALQVGMAWMPTLALYCWMERSRS
ncbi:MAG TPA: O-antigen ligase family protein [Elusimicrobiota bacterium]|nr:O-antigen ligase family protein [Elusimicrobiota bacterium]